uniref:TIR domain-containing protein n=1 Tax=Trichobilharzia regenti TaxID=157069 RepID=A0AA85K907_TRIRE|nr:unnamed protein product [Trichobilharzia regenti]
MTRFLMFTYLLFLYFIDTMKLIRKYLTASTRKVIYTNDKGVNITENISPSEEICSKGDWLIHTESSIGSNDTNQHVLISYSHEEKDVAINLVQLLQEKGYKVWVDYKDMLHEIDIMDGMAKAVENSFVVCILYSKSYKESFNTKCEAQYAYHEKKPLIFLRVERGYVPNGWLGFMMGTRLYIDISGKYPFEEKFIDLCQRIDEYKQISDDQTNYQSQDKMLQTGVVQECQCFSG